MTKRTTIARLGLALATTALLAGCSAAAGSTAPDSDGLRHVVFTQPYVASEHLGVYVAQAKGYFADEGLDVEIQDISGDVSKEAIVTQGRSQFGISWQEDVTQARAEGIPIVSIANIIAHNTSALISLGDSGVESPAGFGGKTYGGWGSPIEEAIVKGLAAKEGVDPSTVGIVNTGATSSYDAVKNGQVDISWIFYHDYGIAAELQGVDLNYIFLKDVDPVLDWYTPVYTTSEELIEEDPELVQSFVTAIKRAYEFAIAHPDEAADIFLEAVPEFDAETTHAGLEWLAPEFQADAPEWGWQTDTVWGGFTQWLEDAGIVEPGFDWKAAYTNEFVENATPYDVE